MPPLDLMEGYYDSLESDGCGTLFHGSETRAGTYLRQLDALLPIKWECLAPDPLLELLTCGDCEDEIPADRCAVVADSLEKLIPLLPEGEAPGHVRNWREATQRFVNGLRRAAAEGEPLRIR